MGQIGQIAGVQADATLGNALGQQDLLEGPDCVGDPGLEHIVGVHQQSGAVGIELAVGLEGGIFIGEHLHPGVGHGAGGRGAVPLIGHGAGGGGAAGDIAGPGPQQGAVGPLGPAGAEFRDGAPLGRPDDAVGLGGDQALVVQGEQQEGFNKLCLDGGGPDRKQRLTRENRGALRHGPDITGETEGAEKVQKILAEAALGPQISQVLLVKMQLLNVFNDLGQTGGKRKARLVGHRTVEYVKIADTVLQSGLKVAVCHCQLVKVTQHGQIGFGFHWWRRPLTG